MFDNFIGILLYSYIDTRVTKYNISLPSFYIVDVSALAMSLLTVLPRLTSWGSHQKGRELEPIETKDMNRDLKQDIYDYQSRYDIAIARSSKKRKPRRKKISYWSDEEAVSIKASR